MDFFPLCRVWGEWRENVVQMGGASNRIKCWKHFLHRRRKHSRRFFVFLFNRSSNLQPSGLWLHKNLKSYWKFHFGSFLLKFKLLFFYQHTQLLAVHRSEVFFPASSITAKKNCICNYVQSNMKCTFFPGSVMRDVN